MCVCVTKRTRGATTQEVEGGSGATQQDEGDVDIRAMRDNDAEQCARCRVRAALGAAARRATVRSCAMGYPEETDGWIF